MVEKGNWLAKVVLWPLYSHLVQAHSHMFMYTVLSSPNCKNVKNKNLEQRTNGIPSYPHLSYRLILRKPSFSCLRFLFRLLLESWFIPNIRNVTFMIGVGRIYSNVCLLQPALHVSYDSACRKIWKHLSLKFNINISLRKLSVNPGNRLVLEISSVPDPPLAPTK